ncbi:hypothetical protein ABTE72_19745, partial [Acinetobacter baumannii]
MNLPLLKLAEPECIADDSKAEKLLRVAHHLADALVHAGGVTRQFVTRQMLGAFGASDADGAWSMRDAYDALETAQ